MAALLAVMLMAACAQVEKDVGQCEPGVADLSAAATVTPPGC